MSSCSFINKGDSEICFVGDSITHIWDLEYFFPDFVVHKHAENGAVLQDLAKWDLTECKGLTTVFLMGTNNIGHVSIDNSDARIIRKDFVELYLKKISRIEADPLFVVSILPRNFNNRQNSKVNENIEKVNEMIQDSLKKSEMNYEFIDVFDAFLEKDYKIRKSLFYDGLHPSKEGYELLASKILKYL